MDQLKSALPEGIGIGKIRAAYRSSSEQKGTSSLRMGGRRIVSGISVVIYGYCCNGSSTRRYALVLMAAIAQYFYVQSDAGS